jgi:hypothetical protein
MQSTAYHNYLKGSGGRTGPDQSVLRLRSASRSGDPRKIAKAIEELSSNAGLNSKVLHLEGESIFGSTKQSLIFLLETRVIPTVIIESTLLCQKPAETRL